MPEPVERGYFDKWLIADDRGMRLESRHSDRSPEHIWSLKWREVDRYWLHHVTGTGATPDWDQLVVVSTDGVPRRARLESGEVNTFIELLHHHSPCAVQIKGLSRYRAASDLLLLAWNTAAFLVGALTLLCLAALAFVALSHGL